MNTGFLDPAVATVPTACGIETALKPLLKKTYSPVATVPTACGIETKEDFPEIIFWKFKFVATVPTACGIETCTFQLPLIGQLYKLQQYLPLAVLKPGSAKRPEVLAIIGCNSTYRLRY